ncbi:MAG TPA: DegT/DnrJ/EryC1/StrS family aminotransferase [Ignavibacteriaceae bacterium]|nr:DegT/DnrJ/EryC1/StrS family aminotransferase [Ignavibacteriaceae bacterium]
MQKYPKQIGVGGLVLSDYEKQLVNEVLDSNQLTYGPMMKRFEAEFGKSHNCKFALYMNSGTSALHVALAALKDRHGWNDGDEVIVPAVTFVATSNIVLHNNLTPVFVDVEPNTFNIDPTKIEEKITKKTRAIIPVHLLGLPASMGLTMELAKTYRLSIIEDSCETMFAKYEGQTVGSMGDIGCFSTYVAHFLVTGVGGIATTNNPELAVDMRSLMNHGRDSIYISSLDDQGVEGEKLQEIIAKRFSFIHVGHSFRCTEMEAALGVGQLARSAEIIRRRKEIADKFTKELSEFEDRLQLPSCPPDRTHSYMLYGLVLKNENKREFVNYLEDLNIETRDLLPLINQPIYKRLFGNLEAKYPVAKWLNSNAFYIGCHSYMTEEEVDFVIDAFKNYFRNN